ncbi:MAG: glycosyltransferase [Myxococcales bacterium]|nr:MAG: glycosyltransferase [Myxococcales bacterium]
MAPASAERSGRAYSSETGTASLAPGPLRERFARRAARVRVAAERGVGVALTRSAPCCSVRAIVSPRPLRVAVLVPCYNEEVAIGETVRGMKAALPDATVYVYDNNSKDQTGARAREAGAVVYIERLQGKGNVVRRMFSDVEADVYVMTDGDATYDPVPLPGMIDLLVHENLDMVVGKRIHTAQEAYRPGHVLGNKLLTGFLAWLFGQRFTDILSGYRVFSRRFVKSFPSLSAGFEIETELTVHALTLSMPIAERDAKYFARPEGSTSKLNTYRDGIRILSVMLGLFKNERPLAFYGIAGGVLALLSIALAIPIVITFFETGLVPRFPTAILSASIMLLAFLALVCGLVLDTVTRGRREIKRLSYLQIPSPAATLGVMTPSATANARVEAALERASA